MIKTNIKMVVTPEESKQVQEIYFANDISWKSGSKKVLLEHKQYLIIRDCISWEDKERYYLNALEEVDASLFIRTSGTCVEEAPKQELKQNTNKEETMEKNEVKSYADVKEYLIAKGLYEDVLSFDIDFEGLPHFFGNMFWFKKTPQGYEFWMQVNLELIKLGLNTKLTTLLRDYKAKHSKEFIKHLEAQPDEYKDLREALRVGKIIQLNGSAINGGYGETWKDCKQEDLFVWGKDAYRVKPTEQKPKQYLCYVQGKALPKHIHKTLEQAKQEAQRLCGKELAKVSVLEVVAEYEAEVLVKEVL